MIRKVIDWVLTINLIVLTLWGSYLWYSGELVISFSEPQSAAFVQTDIAQAFSTTLRMEVDRSFDTSRIGYEPYMLMEVFPGLAPTDFEGVESVLGIYRIEEGRLVHQMSGNVLRHEAAKTIARTGFKTLLDNVTKRLHINLQTTGTITEVMTAISASE